MLRLLALSPVLLASAIAGAQATSYLGPHPVDLEGGWHFEPTEHDHLRTAVGEDPFGTVDGVRVFLADPIAWGWDREVWVYRGAHPLPGGLPGYCGLSGDHRHPFAPEGRYRRASAGVRVYVGGMRGGLPMVRPARSAPRRPIVRAPAAVSPAPYWFHGCLTTLVLGSSGAAMPVPSLGCTPTSGSLGRRTRGTRAELPPVGGSWFDGNYGRYRAPERGRSPVPAPRPPQSR